MTLPSVVLNFYQSDQTPVPPCFGEGVVLRYEFPFGAYLSNEQRFAPIGHLSGKMIVRPGVLVISSAEWPESVAKPMRVISSLAAKTSGLSENVVLEEVGSKNVLWKGKPNEVFSSLAEKFRIPQNLSSDITFAVPKFRSVVNAYHGLLYALAQSEIHVPDTLGGRIARSMRLLFDPTFYENFKTRILNDSVPRAVSPCGLLKGVASAQWRELKTSVYVPKSDVSDCIFADSQPL